MSNSEREYLNIKNEVAESQLELMAISGYDEDIYQAFESLINEIDGKIEELEAKRTN